MLCKDDVTHFTAYKVDSCRRVGIHWEMITLPDITGDAYSTTYTTAECANATRFARPQQLEDKCEAVVTPDYVLPQFDDDATLFK